MAAELAGVRRKFVDKVSNTVLKQLLDDLVGDVLNEGEKESILEENPARADKARVLIDTMKKKGDAASRKMMDHLLSNDPTLYAELGLSTDQPDQPAPEPQMNQGWSSTLRPTTEKFWKEKVNDRNNYPASKLSMKNRVALLITNIKFSDVRMNRRGAETDEENMEKLLTALGYEVVKHTNLTGKAINDAVIEFSKHQKLKETDSVVVVIMSHGKLGTILGVNWKKDTCEDVFPINNIYKHLNSKNCPALLDKPKVIIIQACRGEDEGSALVKDGADMDVVSDDVSQPELSHFTGDGNIEEDNVRCVHLEKDFTSLLSCTPDTVSYRQTTNGSFLIQYIVDVLNTCACQDHIDELFRKVMLRFEEFSVQTKRQMATKDRCSLPKHFYFYPGL
ncbi:caspase a [Centropristis striata]|uniref:caspase a n=1 Tax=Centropristis striata TaxID=184440 RepID=UPI0027DFDE2A|nr:caspase a [Centropristis striata]